ncbi:MAG: hypothetical protein ACYDCH_15850, partial [Gaiellaceae bacterium]
MIVQIEDPELVPAEALAALAEAVSAAATRDSLAAALGDLVEAARVVAAADLALIRVCAVGDDRLEAIAVAGPAGLAAELEGTHLALADVPSQPVDSLAAAPAVVQRGAARAA